MEKTTIPLEVKCHLLRLYKCVNLDGQYSPEKSLQLYEFAERRHITSDSFDELVLNIEENYEDIVPNRLITKLKFLEDYATILFWDKDSSYRKKLMMYYIVGFGIKGINAELLLNYLLFINGQPMNYNLIGLS